MGAKVKSCSKPLVLTGILLFLIILSFTEPVSSAQGGLAEGQYAYVPNEESNDVFIINTAINTVIATVNVGVYPVGVAISPDGSKVYVANGRSNNVSIIDTVTNAIISTINVGDNPFGIAVKPDGTKAYVTNYGDNTISIIDTATNTIISTINVGDNPFGIEVNPDGSKVYVTNRGSDTVTVIDMPTNTVIATVSVGSNPYGVAVTPDGTKVYVTNCDSATVSVIDTATNTVTATVTVGSEPHGVAVTPDGSKVYVANHKKSSGTVSVIDTATNTVTAMVNVGSYPTGVAVTQDGKKVYVTNYADNTVSVIDTVTNTVTATIDVGTGPSALGQFIGSVPVSTEEDTRAEDTTVEPYLESYTELNYLADQYPAGQLITLTATVGSRSQEIEKPSGKVTFMDRTELIGTADVSSEKARFDTSSLSTGSHSITAQYSGDSKFKPSKSSVFTLTIIETVVPTPSPNLTLNVSNTTTALTSSANQYSVGQPITLIATVEPTSKVAEKPSGTVTFMDGVESMGTETLSAGKAILTTSLLSAGSHSIIAKYEGDNNSRSSISSPYTLTVLGNMSDTMTALTSSANQSSVGQAITLTATIGTPAQGIEKPSGKVTFMDGTRSIGERDLISGKSSLTTSSLSAGQHSITAQYSGDSKFKSSTSSAFTLTVIEDAVAPPKETNISDDEIHVNDNKTINMLDTTIALTSSTNQCAFWQPVTFTATIGTMSQGEGIPSGTVTFMDGTTLIGTIILASGQATLTTSSLSVGPHSITAQYSGDSMFRHSFSSATVVEVSFLQHPLVNGLIVTVFGGIILAIITKKYLDERTS